MSTSKKHRDFVREPMGDKPVTVLPGIGKVLGDKLEKAGVSRADNVYGQYLVHNKDPASFKGWIQGTTSANSKQANDCFNALNQYHDQNS